MNDRYENDYPVTTRRFYAALKEVLKREDREGFNISKFDKWMPRLGSGKQIFGGASAKQIYRKFIQHHKYDHCKYMFEDKQIFSANFQRLFSSIKDQAKENPERLNNLDLFIANFIGKLYKERLKYLPASPPEPYNPSGIKFYGRSIEYDDFTDEELNQFKSERTDHKAYLERLILSEKRTNRRRGLKM